MSAKGESRLKFVMKTVAAKVKSVPCYNVEVSAPNLDLYIKMAQLYIYHCDPNMNRFVGYKPMQKCPFWRHHIRILLLLLRCLLLSR